MDTTQTYDLIYLADHEYGNDTMRKVAEQHFADHPAVQFVWVIEHAGWRLGFRRDGSIWSTANDQAVLQPGPQPSAYSGVCIRRPVWTPPAAESYAGRLAEVFTVGVTTQTVKTWRAWGLDERINARGGLDGYQHQRGRSYAGPPSLWSPERSILRHLRRGLRQPLRPETQADLLDAVSGWLADHADARTLPNLRQVALRAALTSSVFPLVSRAQEGA